MNHWNTTKVWCGRLVVKEKGKKEERKREGGKKEKKKIRDKKFPLQL